MFKIWTLVVYLGTGNVYFPELTETECDLMAESMFQVLDSANVNSFEIYCENSGDIHDFYHK